MTFFTAIFMTMLGSANLAVSPWDGSWKLDPARSSPVAKEGAAEGYRFSLRGDGRELRRCHAQGIGARQLTRGGRFVDVGGIDLGGLESDLSQQVEPAR